VVTSRHGCFNPLGRSPRYQLIGRMGGAQIRSGLIGEDKNLAPTENRNPTDRPSSPYPLAISTVPSQILNKRNTRNIYMGI
jgi:hypothetical protein